MYETSYLIQKNHSNCDTCFAEAKKVSNENAKLRKKMPTLFSILISGW